MSLELAGVVWRSSWGLGSCGSTTRRTSSAPIRLLRPAQTVHLEPIKRTLITLALNGNGLQPMRSYARNSSWIDSGPVKCGSGWKSGCCS
ncbi:hypothetical protein Taro_017311 [Colocasia esculenta]|uniref:Uncharacterized protein n=1 Tax=Colocasia esculenta TaxID=4460 RepID=A0A843UN96_COLES|nr:hypothetical protein [Colocasia esculenta]